MDNNHLCCCLCFLNTVKLIDLTDDVHNIKSIIIKHFEFMDMEDVNRGQAVCQDCLTQISEFHDFYLKVEQAYSNREIQEQPEYLIEIEQIKSEPMVDFDSEAGIIEYNHQSDEEQVQQKPKPSRKKRKKTVKLVIEAQKEIAEEYCDEENKESKKTKQCKQFVDKDGLIRKYISLKCHICSEEFDLVNDVLRHCRAEHDVQGIIKCCGRNFKRRPEVLLHAQEHENPEKYLVCDICDKRFKSRKNVENHKLVVHTEDNDKPYSCDKCPKRFSLLGMLNSHKVFHEERKCKCNICGKLTSNKSLLNSHMKIHENTHQFMCEMCSKSYTCRRDLENHMFIHITEKVECDICGAQVKNLEKHKKSHIDLKLECPECKKVLATRSALKGHIEYQHRTEKALLCSYCDKTFKKALNLKEHMATHTGEVLYTCPYCPATFNSNANMYRHRKLCEERKPSSMSSSS